MKKTLKVIGVVAAVVFVLLYSAYRELITDYKKLESVAIKDRNGVVLTLAPNTKGEYAHYEDALPPHIAEMLVLKEDRFFYVHPGINPISTVRATLKYVRGRPVGGASTITQQLVKNLLGHEQNRSFFNKSIEVMYAFALEIFTSKQQILAMYANTVYMGNQIRGLEHASRAYFNQPLSDIDDTKLALLLATLSSPSTQNPWKALNQTEGAQLASRLGLTFDLSSARTTPKNSYVPPRSFELATMQETCITTCTTTLDADLTERLRKILARNVEQGWSSGARSGAIVVIKLPEKELLSIVGTPDTSSQEAGQQINMAIRPRPIGSTAKPFIYLEGFTKGLRPYTLVNDREYKFPIGSGFPLYPKNYDGTYRGWITLHTALSNSLNVPSVKTLQYIGLNQFYDFLEHTLGFIPLQDLDTYQYGIALGALEMDPLTLAHFLTIFPAEGVLKPLRLFTGGTSTPFIETPMSRIGREKKVAAPEMTELVSKVLNDRLAGVNQFGLASSLNLSQSNYAVKTGTSQDYHDSWTIGYTPDFLVVVWFGDPENAALKHITGQSGAGNIWHDTMELLIHSPYNKKTPLALTHVREIEIEGDIDFGLHDDAVTEHRNLLPDDTLITSPQDGDTFLKETRTAIPLVSPEPVSWYANNQFIGSGTRVLFLPSSLGDYTLRAVNQEGANSHIVIHITERQ